MALPPVRRYLLELLHNYKLSYEIVGEYSGIEPKRVKAIKNGEQATEEEMMRLRTVAFHLADLRAKDTGEEND